MNKPVDATLHPGPDPILRVKDLEVSFKVRQRRSFLGRTQNLKAINGVSFTLACEETLGIVGESGCGKSTLARAILGLLPASGGRVSLFGRELARLNAKALRRMRQKMQIIFQDPIASLDPRMRALELVSEPLQTFHGALGRRAIRQRAEEMLARVGLSAAEMQRYPHAFSGGQCQRIGIARALILKPELLICDEPVSSLDLSVRAQIINLLLDIQRDTGLALIFIAHDLSVVRHISQRIMVMYLGRVVELAERDPLYARPRHPYTQALLAAVPVPDPAEARRRGAVALQGDLPSPIDSPSGCVFRTRCPYAIERCALEAPVLRQVGQSMVACHRAEEIAAASRRDLQ